ncbi:hypothetical protein [Nonomuraea salmonea]|uniref:hypothetical protein n=1 Tax=Nonomuraea salmonea TaxID=46181 RepID=UPI002FEBE686
MRVPRKSPALACALTLLATALSGAVPAHAAADDPVIAPEVLARFDARPTTDFWVRMSGKADLAPPPRRSPAAPPAAGTWSNGCTPEPTATRSRCANCSRRKE